MAGKRQGMSASQADGGTRSGLLWEVERILDELVNSKCVCVSSTLPQILLMENVPEVIGSNNVKDFVKWTNKLESLGYSNYFEILNAKDYAIPQNRRRCFMISILGDYSYDFPIKLPLKRKLEDMLEDKVDEKYYISQKMLDYITAENDKWTGNNNGAIVNRTTAVTLNTAPTQRRCDASNYIADDLPENTDLRNIKQQLCDELIQDNKVQKGDIVKHSNTSQIMSGNKKSVEKQGEMITLTTLGDCFGVVVSETSGGGIKINEATSKGYKIGYVGDGVDISSRMRTHRGTVQKETCQTLTTNGKDVGVIVKKDE